MIISEDREVHLDNNTPKTVPDASTDSGHESTPASGVEASAVNDAYKAFDGGRLNWLPLRDQQTGDLGQDVQRTMQGLVLGSIPPAPYGEPGNSSSSGYVNSGGSNTADTGMSPDTGRSGSNRPTPNSPSPSEPRLNMQAGQSNPGGSPYETSSGTSHQVQHSTSHNRTLDSFFSTQPDYSGIPAMGLASDNPFNIPETPSRDFPPGWEMTEQTTGLTPIGEGVFRHLYGLGPLDPMPMDLGWEGNS